MLLSTAAFPSTLLSCLWDIPNCFFHCKKEFYHSLLFVTTITGRLHFEELQRRCRVWNLCKLVHRMREVKMCATWNNSFLALLFAEKKTVGHYFLGNFCTQTDVENKHANKYIYCISYTRAHLQFTMLSLHPKYKLICWVI